MKATKLRKLLKTRQKEPAFSRLCTEIRSNVMVLTETLHELRIDSFNGCVNVAFYFRLTRLCTHDLVIPSPRPER